MQGVRIASVGGMDWVQQQESRLHVHVASAVVFVDARTRFDLVGFNDVVRAYSSAMTSASEVKKAQAWVAALRAADSTNIHDALEEAFLIGGLGSADRYTTSAIDTIVLLTDGTPTLNNGELDETERIHAAVEAWNPLHRVIIHTVGIGREVNESFLARIAEDNGGRYVHM